jgi:hypothetical protein
LRRMTPDAAVTEWLPAPGRRAPDAASCAPAGLAALNSVGALATVTVLFPTRQEFGRLGSVAARGPLAILTSGRLLSRLASLSTLLRLERRSKGSRCCIQGTTPGVSSLTLPARGARPPKDHYRYA